MSDNATGFQLQRGAEGTLELTLTGNWTRGESREDFPRLQSELAAAAPTTLLVNGSGLGDWDSSLLAFLLRSHDYCLEAGIGFKPQQLPQGAARLLELATAVKPHRAEETEDSLLGTLHPGQALRNFAAGSRESLAFFGDVSIALGRLLRGNANTRFADFRHFCYQAGPDAFAIISLTSLLVGMILAYLGAVQLRQFGAEIYVADLVVIGMSREMGALMTAIVMAGRTGAAYAAQLGTMQTNEEIDAITTMGISPIEFLVMPRMLALIAVMPLLTVYADLLGIVGGGIVAGGMGITPLQYFNSGAGALTFPHLLVGLLKSLVFAVLIAIAGCRSGINSGRSSAAVGQATTEAVVTAVVYLIVADAAINIIFQQVGL